MMEGGHIAKLQPKPKLGVRTCSGARAKAPCLRGPSDDPSNVVLPDPQIHSPDYTTHQEKCGTVTYLLFLST